MDQQIATLMQLLFYARAKLDESERVRDDQATQLAQLRFDKEETDRRLEAAKSEVRSLTELLLHSRA